MQDLHAVMNALLQEWKGYLILDHSPTLNGEALRKLLGVSRDPSMGLPPMMATFRVEGPCDGRYNLTEQTADYLIGQGHMAYDGAVWRWPAENREAREVTMTAESAVRILLDMRPTFGVTITARIVGPCPLEAARDLERATKVQPSEGDADA